MKLLKLVPDNTNFRFLRWRHIAMGISIFSIIASLVLVGVRGLNLGVDFVGGQMIQVTFDKVAEAPVAELREDIEALNLGESTIQRFGQPNQVSVRMRLDGDNPDEVNAVTKRVTTMITKEYAAQGARIDGVDSVSGKVSEELLTTGVYSLVFAMIAIAVYIWFRFEWQFGVAALFALFHDVAITFGFFALTQLEFNLNIIAALLTIIGYSLNDTIVVFDRVRENLRKYRKMDMISLLDLSTNETLSRTVMTSLTMLMALMALLLIGPGVIFGFTAAMTLGLFVGCYSSIYMANPILVWLGVGPHSFVPQQTEADKAEAKLKEGL
ncbi:protein translocase subunit SecF [Sphingomonas ursincola]|jgi:preprotein translocase subunit SecF|uniref:Protein-export membrane protein SecF n=1 Tax=Sphingomonas ursincola TaxID=56361 RepID=A0A7V8RBH0_9SPHN|nr:protein translocase subunit SecF [Sphingomonas ursincola]MBA1373407.1 protein translocase subunit SecF [Sphingomonas ursincola]MBY0618602.1 protein translocase subunit SecF [Sphingomonas ursincola]MCH2237305.1 protein translocase subunit SecF [Blastomonas sp.]OHD01745.1 MAG: protein-export membrane protein SecF [Sphingopyxis sp. RIFCSPHIGHO2_01_FULL_65_24]